MTSEQLEFHNAFLDRGGLFDPSQLGEHAKAFESIKTSIYEYVTRSKKVNNRLPFVNIDFINNNEVNAVATKKCGKYFIGIYWGTYFLLWNLFLRMMTSSKVLPHIGNASNEKVIKIFSPFQLSLSSLMLASPHDQKVSPIDRTRNVHAGQLTMSAINFLFFHEYAHIIFGHVDLIEHLKYDFSLNEIVRSIDKADSLLMQTLEMDADCFAFANSIRLLQQLNDDDSKEPIPIEQRGFYINLENGIQNLLFSSYSLFRLFGYKTYPPEEIARYCHPPPAMRQFFIFSLLSSMYIGHKDENKLLALVTQTIGDVENAFQEISESVIDRATFIEVFSPGYTQHFRSIMLNWNKIRPQLEPCAYGNLAPLDESWESWTGFLPSKSIPDMR